MTSLLKRSGAYIGGWLSRLGDFFGVAWFVFIRGLSASRRYVAINVCFELAGLFWVFAASLCLSVLLAGDRIKELPFNLQTYIPGTNLMKYAIIGLLVSMLLGSIFRFLATYVINISLPKVESQFYKLTAEKFAAANISQLSELEMDVAEYMKRDLSMNTRFALMVYRRSVLALVPILSVVILLPIVAYTNLGITLIMGLFFILMVPVYYKINKRSNQITLEMETLTRSATGQRRRTAETILDDDYKIEDKDAVIARSLAENHADIQKFFHLYGERFTTMHGTNLVNAIVLFMVVGVLIYFNFSPSADGGEFNVIGFTIIMVMLRQLHTGISRVLLVLNVMSRFYTKLLSLKKIDQQLAKMLAANSETLPTTKPIDHLAYKHIDSGAGKNFGMKPGNLHVIFDATLPSRLSLLGLKPATDVIQFNQFISTQSNTTLRREDNVFSFASEIDAGQDMDTLITKYLHIIEIFYDSGDLRRTPNTTMTLSEIMKSSLGDGISYMAPGLIRSYEAIIDLITRIADSEPELVFIDARCLKRIKPKFMDKTLELIKATNKLVFIVLSKQTNEGLGLDPDQPVIVCGSPRADGFIEYANIARIVKEKSPILAIDEDEESLEI